MSPAFALGLAGSSSERASGERFRVWTAPPAIASREKRWKPSASYLRHTSEMASKDGSS
eukprot:CAMPEP_0180409198 /NCGR_PEP_ID=MMETSP0989-20121125/42692_1 /TAXON_ID=697907 /ORGANISM="non described non described, Strain CCMP2293" /LENGTH=58 /DNA_ID=CAMNT_0022413207 /DNA_START=69 /DNA_END=242 /DNA_ORIENTATION=-